MSFDPTPEEIADRYRDARQRVIELLDGLSDERLAAVVPGTPKWTGRDLVAHFVGCPIELAAGNFEGAGGEVWTQAQVDARQAASVAELLVEWEAAAPSIDAAIRAGSVPVPVCFDILIHESDLRAAIGAPATPDPLAVRFVADGFGARALRAAAKADLATVALSASDTDWSVGEPGGVSATATEHEWTRALAGRRSRRQVEAYDWSGDAAPYVDVLSPFGPLPDNDVRE